MTPSPRTERPDPALERMTLLVLAKLVVAPAFVVAVTLLGRRLGPSVAGMLAALPVVGGPILA
jgi:hypothetical protein